MDILQTMFLQLSDGEEVWDGKIISRGRQGDGSKNWTTIVFQMIAIGVVVIGTFRDLLQLFTTNRFLYHHKGLSGSYSNDNIESI